MPTLFEKTQMKKLVSNNRFLIAPSFFGGTQLIMKEQKTLLREVYLKKLDLLSSMRIFKSQKKNLFCY